jgi:endonuclease/exonuclease/phosphatase (EEP) superfamily protein YafD
MSEWRVLLRGALWLVVAALVGVVLVRLSGVESRFGLLFSVVALGPLLLAPAWLVLALAWPARDRWLAGAAGLLVLVQLVWLVPDGPWAADRADGPSVRVVSSNVSDVNATPGALAEALLAEDPDVLVLLEYTPTMAQALEVAGVREQLPNAAEDPRFGTAGSAIFSRLPMTSREVLHPGGAPMVAATVVLDAVPTQVVAVHTTQPLVDVAALQRQLGALAGLVGDATGPVVLAGDFNANSQTAGFRAILEAGGTDAARASGQGWSRSWPDRGRWFPVLLLDHVVVAGGVGVHDLTLGPGHGSDHRYVVADIVTPSSPPAAPTQGSSPPAAPTQGPQ